MKSTQRFLKSFIYIHGLDSYQPPVVHPHPGELHLLCDHSRPCVSSSIRAAFPIQLFSCEDSHVVSTISSQSPKPKISTLICYMYMIDSNNSFSFKN